MKRICIAISFVAALLCGCVNNQFDNLQQIRTVTAALEESGTRAALAQDGDAFRMHWEEGDRISVLSSNGNVPFTLTTGAGSAKASFYNEAGVPAGECFAVYPYDATTSLSGSTASITYPSELTFDAATGMAKGGEFMVATSSDGHFQFKNIHSYIDMTFSSLEEDQITGIVVAARNNAVVAGAAEVTFAGGTPQVKMTGSGKAVTVDMGGAPVGPGKPFKVCVPVAPVFNNGIKVTVNCRSGHSRTFTSSAVVGRNIIIWINEAPLMDEPVVKVSSTKYTDISEAFEAARKNFLKPEITLLKDVKYNDVLNVSGNNSYTIDLAGHTLQVKSLVSTARSVTLLDSSPEKSGTIWSDNGRTLRVESGEFTIEGGTIKSKDSCALYVIGDETRNPNVIFNDGVITSVNATYHVSVAANGVFEMNGGSIVAPKGYGIYTYSNIADIYAYANVYGGSITGSPSNVFYLNRRGRVDVRGGFFQTDKGRISHISVGYSDTRAYFRDGYFHAVGYAEGRYFSGYSSISVKNIYVSGGYFNVDPVTESAKACSSLALALDGPGKVEKLDTPVTVNGYRFPYTISRDTEGIIVGYSQNGTSQTVRNRFKKAFSDAGAKVEYFENYVSSDEEAEAYMNKVDALVIPGSASGDGSTRATSDDLLISAALSQGKPVLGVCYGHQHICKVKGGSIVLISKKYPDSTIEHTDGASHMISIDPESILYSLLKTTSIKVNSYHGYCATNGSLKVTATAPDGCIEAVESTAAGECLLGVQFHPEISYSSGRTEFLPIFQYIVDKAKEAKENRK